MAPNSTRIRTALPTAFLALVLLACSSDSESTGTGDTDTEDTDTDDTRGGDTGDPSEPDEPVDSATAVPVFGVGDTFTIDATGTFEATYLGLADLGTAETFQSGDVHCYGVLGEVTMVAEDEVLGASLSAERAVVFDAAGDEFGGLTAGCSPSPLSEAGYTSVFGIEWTEGVSERVYFDFVAVPLGDEARMDRVSPYPAIPAFELEATVTEILVSG